MSVLSVVSYIGLVPGEAQVDQVYGLNTTLFPTYIDGLQGSIQGDAPTGDSLKFALQLDGTDVPGYELIFLSGDVQKVITFETPVLVPLGSTVGLRCEQVGSSSAGSWIELRMNCRLQLS